jgi:hypothetical protein
MCAALILNDGPSRISPDVVRDARFAALVHDLGHGPYSHTSEQYFSVDPGFEEIRSSGKFTTSRGGEMLSCLIAESPHFRNFLLEVNRTFQTDIQPEALTGYIAGQMSGPQRFKSELVHGPFDADKLDYMYRDGHFTGLQIPIDLDRLFYSIAIHTDGAGDLCRLCGSTTATSPLMQIAFNKMLLFAGVYHHHKVRAVDCMIWSIFRLAQSTRCMVGGIQLVGAADYLRITDDQLLIPELCDEGPVRRLVSEVRERHLWKRALVISRSTVPKGHWDPKDGDGTFHDLVSLSEASKLTIERRVEISEAIARAAGVDEHQVWLDVPEPPSAGEAQNMWIKVPGSDTPMTLSQVMPIKQWVEIYANTRYAAHVFCPAEARQAVNTAAIDVLRSELGLTFMQQATDFAKIQ